MTEPLTNNWHERPFEERAEAVLSQRFQGIHHCGEITKTKGAWATNKYGDLSTFDFDELTRLVLAAHHYCIRASVQHPGPRMVKIVLSPRTREGAIFNRHPTIEQGIESMQFPLASAPPA